MFKRHKDQRRERNINYSTGWRDIKRHLVYSHSIES
uniref:Uncharacterized protein n=1 Tax=Rhizophora mucronata TaxID=61149 RepID=A0A2P2MDC8_RHIMU